MASRLLIIALWALLASGARSECDCLWQGSFAEVQAGASLVLSGTVIAAKGNSIDIAIDRLLRGVGTTRGRRSSSGLRVNDVVDFWRVEEIEYNKQLLLRAEMKVPGYAWLEFRVDEISGDKNRLSVNAYYKTKGLWGHTYWYIFIPFHHFIISDLIKQIERRSLD